MSNNPYGSYLEDRILSATPLELVRILYDAALNEVQAARRHLAAGAIAERSRAVSKAVAILGELSGSLDHSAGGDLSARLAALYDYVQRTLLDANFRQQDDGLAEGERLLVTLAEAWDRIAAPAPVPVPQAPAAIHQWSA